MCFVLEDNDVEPFQCAAGVIGRVGTLLWDCHIRNEDAIKTELEAV